jgi:hypothetical protein
MNSRVYALEYPLSTVNGFVKHRTSTPKMKSLAFRCPKRMVMRMTHLTPCMLYSNLL